MLRLTKRLNYVIGVIAMLLMFGVSAAPFSAAAQSVLTTGSDMPMKTREMPATTDGSATIASVKGEKGTVVVFWCNTCPWVKRYESRLVKQAKAYQAKGFGFIAINSNDAIGYPGDSIDEMKKQSSSGGYSFPYVVDEGSEMASAFGAKRTPQVFVFNSVDKLVYQGAIDDSPADPDKVEDDYLAAALDSVASGGVVSPAETKAFGCTIKFQ